MGRPLRIAIIASRQSACVRGVMSGIRKYYAGNHRLTFLLINDWSRSIYGDLAQWRPDGVLGQVAQLKDWRQMWRLTRRGACIVNTSTSLADPPWPSVLPDGYAAGRLAAEHFLERGYRRFGFFCNPLHGCSALRGRGFVQTVEAAGQRCAVFQSPQAQGQSQRYWATEPNVKELARWLKGLTYPVAIFAASDNRALAVSQVCQQQGIRIPDQVALVGVDNDETVCSFSTPPLSSVELPSERIGFEAAHLLGRLMAGAPPPEEPIRLPPVRVVTRQSSDALSIADPDVVAALRFIRERAHRPIRVEDVLAEVPVSRSWLERKFQELLGRTPAEEIRRVHLERIKHLLVESPLSIPAIAAASGSSSLANMSHKFKRATGLSPSQYRQRFRVP